MILRFFFSLLKFIMYADETTLSIEIYDWYTSETTIITKLSKVSKWLYSAHLILNFLKTQYIRFQKPWANLPDSYLPGWWGSAIWRVLEIKTIAVYLDPCLRFDWFIKEVVKNLSKILSIIYKKNLFSEQCLKVLYCAFIYPKFIYCASIWAGMYRSIVNGVFIAQTWIIRQFSNVWQ